MTTIKNLPLREKYSANGSLIRWGATILVVVLVMFFEFYLFSRYSLWQNTAGKSGGIIQEQSANSSLVTSTPVPQNNKVEQHPAVTTTVKEFHPVVPSPVIPDEKPAPPTSGESITIVDRESMSLMPGTDFKMVLRGILELETNNDYLLAPEREAAIYNSCRLISSVWDDSNTRSSEIEKCRFLFFASLNQKQIQFVRNNMKLWTEGYGKYKAPENEDQEKYLLKKCMELLSERVHK